VYEDAYKANKTPDEGIHRDNIVTSFLAMCSEVEETLNGEK